MGFKVEVYVRVLQVNLFFLESWFTGFNPATKVFFEKSGRENYYKQGGRGQGEG